MTAESTDIKNLSQDELEHMMLTLGQERYRARQLIKWLYKQGVSDFDEMTDLSKAFRQTLRRRASISSLVPSRVETSVDGTEKFVFPLVDGNHVESVLVPDGTRLTLCISTQVGCALGCRFCLTGKMGFIRNLTPSEILNQILAVQGHEPPERRLTNIVLMGMGEPLANYDSTVTSIEMMQNDLGFGFSGRRITLSTSGLVPAMERLMTSLLRFQLAVSLNAADDATRSFLMPINKSHPMKRVLEICRRFPLPPRERVSFEYVLIDGINDSPRDAHRLAHLVKGIPCKINLIPLNESPDLEFRRSTDEKVDTFQMILLDSHITCTVRKSRGGDISAACGQLGGNSRRFPQNPPSNLGI
jgi:23S rRNA (adenine2503-C2)-methyltransferase